MKITNKKTNKKATKQIKPNKDISEIHCHQSSKQKSRGHTQKYQIQKSHNLLRNYE